MASIDEKRLKLKRLRLQKLREGAVNQKPISGPREPSSQERMAQGINQAQKQSFNELPFYDKLLAGAGRTAYSTPMIKHITNLVTGREQAPMEENPQVTMPDNLRYGWGALTDHSMGSTQGFRQSQIDKEEIFNPYDQASEGSGMARAGEIIGDLAMLGLPIGKGEKAIRSVKGLGNISKTLLTGAGAGAGSSVVHQAQNVGSGKEISGKEAGFETVLSTAIPFIGSQVSRVTTPIAKKIIQTAVKSTKKIKGKKVLSESQAERFLENYGSWRGLKASGDKIDVHHEQLGEQFDNLIKKVAKGKQVNILGSITSAKKRISRLSKTGGIDLTDVKKINKTIDEFEEIIEPLLNKNGEIDFKLAQKFKKHTLDPKALWDKPTPLGPVDPALNAPAQASRTMRSKLVKDMSKVEPTLSPLNKEFKQMAEIEPFVQNAVERASANRGLSLQDLMTLAPGVLGMGGAAYMDKPGYGALAMLPFLASRAQKSPALASMLYDVGKNMGSPSAMKDLIKQGGRSTAFGGGN